MGEPEREAVFICADRFGREVVLREEMWYDHILDQHPELANREAAVESTIRLAEQIRIDRFRNDRRSYYRRNMLSPPYQHDFLKVVVQFYVPDAVSVVRGEVVTAYAVVAIDRRETHEW